jgi:chromosome partitioning protein
MPKAISLVNMKGGVGKSTLAVNLAWEYATAPWYKDVLLVDLDPQFNATQYTIGQAEYEQKVLKQQSPTVWDLFEQRSRLPGRPRKPFKVEDAILEVYSFRQGSLALLPSRLELAFSLRNPSQKETLLARALADVEDDYDVIIIDCPPTESLLTYAA